MLSPAFAEEWYYVICFEAVNDTTILVSSHEPFFECFFVKISGDVGKLFPTCPNVIASEEELISKDCGVHAVENLIIVKSDIVEAYILRLRHKAYTFLLIECVSVKVVVDGVVIYHLRDRQVMKESRRLYAPKILGETLHQQSLANAGATHQHNVLVQLIASAWEYFFSKFAVIEIV